MKVDFQQLTRAGESHESKCPTFRENRHGERCAEGQKSFTKRRQPNKQLTKFSKYSTIKSQTSITSQPVSDYDVEGHLEKLQQKIVQEILVLKQQKLTLMQQQNTCTYERHRVQRELARQKKKSTQKSFISNSASQQKIAPTSQTDEECYFGDNYFNTNQYGPQQLQTAQRIQNLRRYIKCIEQQINSNIYEEKVSPCESFIEKLKKKKEKLLHLIITQSKHQQLKQCLFSLIKSNQELQSVIDWHLHQNKYILERLREKVKQEEEEKQKFLEELISFKSKTKHLRIENEQLRKAILYFRY